MPDERPSAPSALWLCLLGAVIVFFAVHAGRAWDFTVDDAAISFAYAHNLAVGHGLVLTPGSERVEAMTNLLWVMLLAPADALHVSHESLSKVLGVLFGAASLGCVALFPAAAYARKPRYFDLVAPAMAATFAHVALWSVSGLENGLVSFLISLSLLAAAAEEADPERAPWSSVALSLLFAARPDGALYALAIGAARALRAAFKGARRQDIFWALGLALGVGSIELFRLAYFAWPLPNSFYSKRHVFHFGRDLFHASAPGWRYVVGWIGAYKLVRVLKLIPAAALYPKAPFARVALALCVLASIALPVYANGDWMEEWRLLTYATPILCLLLAEATRALVRFPLASLPPLTRRWFSPVLFAIGALALLYSTTRSYADRFVAIRQHSTLELRDARGRARYFAAAARSLDLRDASVLDPDIGGLASTSGLRVVDLFGLGDVAIARTHHVDEPGMREVIFSERRPTFAHLHGLWFSASYLFRLEELDQLYFVLPSALAGENAIGLNFVRRDVIAAPWTEELETAPRPAGVASSVDAFTRSADAADPGERVLVELTFYNAQHLEANELVASSADGTPRSTPLSIGGALIERREFLAGERPWARGALRLPTGRYALRWHSPSADVALGELVVAPGAGARDRALQIRSLDAALGARRLRDARGVALRLSLRARVDRDPSIDAALGRYARALAEVASRLGEHGAFAAAASSAREARRFSTSDAEANNLNTRLAERMADASRRAERRGDARAAFSLARDAVLIDPRRSWMRRRAEELRAQLRGDYDGGRELAAYQTATLALSPMPSAPTLRDPALALLGGASRWSETAALADRTGHEPATPWARLALARARLARGEIAEALRLAQTVPCGVARDPDLIAGLRALTGRALRPGDGACDDSRPRRSDTPWRTEAAPFNAEIGSFEAGNFRAWTVAGNAFGAAPVQTGDASQAPVNGWRGRYFASSLGGGGNARMGSLRSPAFTIETDAISFLLGGGDDPANVGVRLLIDGREVLRSTGRHTEAMLRTYWDVSSWIGRTAVIEVYDSSVGSWGYVMVDDFIAEPAAITTQHPMLVAE